MTRGQEAKSVKASGKSTVIVLTTVGWLLGCAKAGPVPAPAPTPSPVPEAMPEAAVAAAPAMARVAGRYRLTADVQREQRRRGRRTAPAATPLRLEAVVASDADGMAAVSPQYRAVVTIPGYTSSGRGASRATWWPARGDSVVVHIVQARGDRVQLRGAVTQSGLAGDVWFISSGTGSTYQIGTFTAARTR